MLTLFGELKCLFDLCMWSWRGGVVGMGAALNESLSPKRSKEHLHKSTLCRRSSFEMCNSYILFPEFVQNKFTLRSYISWYGHHVYKNRVIDIGLYSYMLLGGVQMVFSQPDSDCIFCWNLFSTHIVKLHLNPYRTSFCQEDDVMSRNKENIKGNSHL